MLTDHDTFPGQVAECGGEMIDTFHTTMLSYAREFGLAREDLERTPGSFRYHFFGSLHAEDEVVAQWRALDEDYTSKMLRAIVAFELRVLDLQCTLKLNQHRPESHAALHAAYRAGSADAQALAQWMETLGLVPGQKE